MTKIAAGMGIAVVLASTLGAAAPVRIKELPKTKDSGQTIFEALRQGDLNGAKSLLDRGASANTRNDAGETPLMYAALYSDAAGIKLLLDRGADPNAASAKGVTALMWSVDDIRKVRLLVTAGADVNAKSGGGRTPLMIAASRYGSAEVVKFLLSKGAEVNAVDKTFGPPLVPIGAGASTALFEAAKIDEPATVRWLLEQGAEVNSKDRAETTPLAAAVLFGNIQNVKLLLAKGADVNIATKAGYTPLMYGAIRGNVEVMRMLLARNADANARDQAGNTALMWAAYSEYGDPKPVALLLKAGADPDIRNKAGETARMWALRRGNTAAVKLLGGAAEPVSAVASPAGGGEEWNLRTSVEKAIAALQSSQPQFVKVSGCVSCHHQFLPSMAFAAARQKSLYVDEKIAGFQVKATMGMAGAFRDSLFELADGMPDMNITGSYALIGLAAEKKPADRNTDALVIHLAAKQSPDGHWIGWGFRPPLETGQIEPTALSMRALQLYAPEGKRAEYARRVEKAREWLLAATPLTTQERALRLLGLVWSNAPRQAIDRAAAELAATQREDGGWAQLDNLTSDAYATGQAMVALQESGMTPVFSVYRKGVSFLRSSQAADGTWRVKTRSVPVQVLRDSGFPHGNDQWISASGTAWAALALTAAVE
jgi:ankyrin repeat protein